MGSEAEKKVILAVDDNPSILKSINFFLRDNYTVYTLPEPKKIVSLLAKISPDIFILDCNMPDIKGFDLIPFIRSFPDHKNTPIIFLTGEGTKDNLTEAMKLGASDFLIKPIDENLLREKVAKYI